MATEAGSKKASEGPKPGTQAWAIRRYKRAYNAIRALRKECKDEDESAALVEWEGDLYKRLLLAGAK